MKSWPRQAVGIFVTLMLENLYEPAPAELVKEESGVMIKDCSSEQATVRALPWPNSKAPPELIETLGARVVCR